MISINPITSTYSSILENSTKNTLGKNTSDYSNNEFKQLLEKSNNNHKMENLKKLMEVSKAFEALLVKEVFKKLTKNQFKGGLIKENNATKIFKDFLNTERSQTITRTSNLGIAQMIYQQQSSHLQ